MIRPTVIYSSQVWGIKEKSFQTQKKNLALLNLLQNNYLRHNTGGYKRYLRVALEREVTIAPLNLYIKVTAIQRAAKIANIPVKSDIKRVINNI